MYLGFERLPEAAGLPVFRRKWNGGGAPAGAEALYYAPGYAARAAGEARTALEREIAAQQAEQRAAERATQPAPIAVTPSASPEAAASGEAEALAEFTAAGVASMLLQHAREAQARWSRLLSQPYQPVCLTVYPENRCNLRCEYCYSAPDGAAAPASPDGAHSNGRHPLQVDIVREAAALVAATCREKGLPLTLVVHGGGEPTLDRPALSAILEVAADTAEAYGLPLFRYIATNGVMSRSTARWLAGTFEQIGLSYDGPGDIHRQQRPLPDGASSAPYVERTAGVLREAGAAFNVRVTVTPRTIARQEEIVADICARLLPQEIHIEPVYLGGRAIAGSSPTGHDLADAFVRHFNAAQSLARQNGVRVLFTGTRPGEIHGPYCQILRGVLNLVPGDVATPCFKLSDAQQVDGLDAAIGGVGEEGFALDAGKIRDLRRVLSALPARCRGCFNQYHCARACPDGCPLEPSNGTDHSTFRCRVQMRLAATAIEQAVEALPDAPIAGMQIH